ncbi:MAG: P-loop NTPase fold protein [Candidatus Desantisbacteria bacterium]
MPKASSLKDVINYFDSQNPLPKNDPWFVDTKRKEIEIIKNAFLESNRSLKFLLGGHPGNGKSTELNKMDNDEEINAKYLVVKYSANEVLDLNDVNVIDLLLTLIFKILEKVEEKNISLPDNLFNQLKDMEGFFTDKLKIEKTTTNARQGKIGMGVEAKLGSSFPLVGLMATCFAKMQLESETRKKTREEYNPKITELQKLINDIIRTIKVSLKPPQFDILLIVDDMDKIRPEQAEKLFSEEGSVIGGIQCSALLTLPISMIYSPKSGIIVSKIGQQKVLRNLRLKDKHGNEDESTKEHKDILRQIVFKRMEENLIEKDALDSAIMMSGGIFSTMIDLITSAASYSRVNNGTKIDIIDMQEAINEERANKKRALNRTYYDILLEIHDYKKPLSTNRVETLELFHSLFALEYMNGEEWCDIHPLLIEDVKEYKTIKQNEQA